MCRDLLIKKFILFFGIFFCNMLSGWDNANVDVIHAILKELIENDHDLSIINAIEKTGILGKKTRDNVLFREKFLKLSSEHQKKKIEKWLVKDHYRIQLIVNGKRVESIFKNLSLDTESIEFLDTMLENLNQESYMFALLNIACIQAIAENKEIFDIGTIEARRFLHKLDVKMSYYKERKESLKKFQRRAEILDELEQDELEIADLVMYNP